MLIYGKEHRCRAEISEYFVHILHESFCIINDSQMKLYGGDPLEKSLKRLIDPKEFYDNQSTSGKRNAIKTTARAH